jgi:hypothetical protein
MGAGRRLIGDAPQGITAWRSLDDIGDAVSTWRLFFLFIKMAFVFPIHPFRFHIDKFRATGSVSKADSGRNDAVFRRLESHCSSLGL